MIRRLDGMTNDQKTMHYFYDSYILLLFWGMGFHSPVPLGTPGLTAKAPSTNTAGDQRSIRPSGKCWYPPPSNHENHRSSIRQTNSRSFVKDLMKPSRTDKNSRGNCALFSIKSNTAGWNLEQKSALVYLVRGTQNLEVWSCVTGNIFWQ